MPAFTLQCGNTKHMLSLTLIYKSSTIQVNHNEIESLFHVWRVIKNGKTEKYTQESSHAGFQGEHPAFSEGPEFRTAFFFLSFNSLFEINDLKFFPDFIFSPLLCLLCQEFSKIPKSSDMYLTLF